MWCIYIRRGTAGHETRDCGTLDIQMYGCHSVTALQLNN